MARRGSIRRRTVFFSGSFQIQFGVRYYPGCTGCRGHLGNHISSISNPLPLLEKGNMRIKPELLCTSLPHTTLLSHLTLENRTGASIIFRSPEHPLPHLLFISNAVRMLFITLNTSVLTPLCSFTSAC